LGLVLG